MLFSHLQRNNRFIQLIQPTPLVQVQLDEGAPPIWCKLEFLNPSGSTKDRIARYILEKAWRAGRIRAGSQVVEASSGSTSIALALACAQMGLRFTAVMPESVSSERILMIRAYGGDTILVPKQDGILGAMKRAEQESREHGAFLPRQFENPDNPEAHTISTAQEILAQMPGGIVDGVVSGVGTGGTLVGLYRGFSQSGCHAQPFAVRPVAAGDYLEVEGCSFSVRIPGVVDGLSKLYSKDSLPGGTEIEIADSDALHVTKRLIAAGFPVGPSSGLNFCGALEAAKQLGQDAAIVTVFPDRMERYFSTELFADARRACANAANSYAERT